MDEHEAIERRQAENVIAQTKAVFKRGEVGGRIGLGTPPVASSETDSFKTDEEMLFEVMVDIEETQLYKDVQAGVKASYTVAEQETRYLHEQLKKRPQDFKGTALADRAKIVAI